MTLKIFNSKSWVLLCSSILLVFLPQVCNGQSNISFERLSTRDGLSQSDVNCMYQDAEGFMWFGTFDGLNKYDGYSFTNYVPIRNEENSISSNIIYSITGDKKGMLWIGTTGSGLNSFNKKTEKFTNYLHDDKDPTTLRSNHITCSIIDRKNRLWIGTDSGLDMLDLNEIDEKAKFRHLENEGANFIRSIYEDWAGNVWVSSNNRLLKVVENKENECKLIQFKYNFNKKLPAITFLGKDHEGRLLIGTASGVLVKEHEGNTLKQVIRNVGTSMVVDDKNQYWMGALNGLFQYENDTISNTLKLKNHFTYDPINPNSLSKNIVNQLFVDKTGIIWIGTNGGGINKINPVKKNFQHVKRTSDTNSLSYDKIRALFEDSNKNLWVGTEGGGLNLLPKEKRKSYNDFKKFNINKRNFALEEAEVNGRKTLLIGSGSDRGLFKLDIERAIENDNEKVELLAQTLKTVFTILESEDKTIWLGTYGAGVYRLIPKPNSEGYVIDVFKNSTNEPKSLPNDIVRKIYQDSNGDIWFGTSNGLALLSNDQLLNETLNFKVFRNEKSNKKSLSYNHILPIFESSKGDVFIGTFGGGLNRYIPQGENQEEGFKTYSIEDGLPNNVIKAIEEDDAGNLWISTNKGLSKFDPITETFKNYDVNDGLQDNEFQELASCKRQNGELVFGGINGFNVFKPSEIKDNLLPAETIISDFSIFGNPLRVGKEYEGDVLLDSSLNYTKSINLNYNQNSFSFKFSGLHFEAPQKNQYMYILEGYDKDWTITSSSNRIANYTNIEPGSYIFKVQASNGDGIWDETPKTIHLLIQPPFWKTNLAYLFYSLLVLGILFAFRRYTVIKTTRKHQLELEHIEKEKNKELQQVKLEFFTNISHEFRTPLTLIKGPLDFLINTEDDLDNEEVQEQYQIMQKNTNYLSRLVNQLLDFRKINQGKMRLVIRNTDIISFIEDIGEPFQFLASKQKIDFQIKAEQKTLKAWFDHDAIEKVMKNLLSNAFKFTPEHGKITIGISKDVDEKQSTLGFVKIEVKNTGNGIDAQEMNNVFNRFYTKKNRNADFEQGAGIGLAFTKNLIEFHKGKIEVKSDVNEYTSFIVKLPLNKNTYQNIPEISIKDKEESDFMVRSSEQESFAIDLNDEITDSAISKSRSKLPLLLIVDDNKDIRTFVGKALKKSYKIIEAKNGKEGLDMALETLPNIIITDVLMPVMDGIEFCEKLKSLNETSHIPVIMLTAKSSNESEIEGLKIGADAYIKKPFDIKILKLKLANILKNRAELRKKFNRETTLQPEEVTVTSADEKFLQRAIEIVEKHMMNTDFSVELLVNEMGLSRSNLYVKFKDLTGLSSSAFIRNIRLKRAMQLLEQSDLSVKEIMYMTGFNTSSYFAKCFKKQFGMLPRDYVNTHKNRRIEHKETF